MEEGKVSVPSHKSRIKPPTIGKFERSKMKRSISKDNLSKQNVDPNSDQIQELKNKIASLKGKNRQMKDELYTLKSEIYKSVESENGDTRNELYQLNTEIMELVEENRKINSEKMQLLDENNRLKKEFEEKIEFIKSNTTNAEDQVIIYQLRNEIIKHENENIRLIKEKKQLSDRIRLLSNDNESRISLIESLKKKIDFMVQERNLSNVELEKERHFKNIQNNSVTELLGSHEEEIMSLKTQLDKMVEEKNMFDAERESLIEEINRLKNLQDNNELLTNDNNLLNEKLNFLIQELSKAHLQYKQDISILSDKDNMNSMNNSKVIIDDIKKIESELYEMKLCIENLNNEKHQIEEYYENKVKSLSYDLSEKENTINMTNARINNYEISVNKYDTEISNSRQTLNETNMYLDKVEHSLKMAQMQIKEKDEKIYILETEKEKHMEQLQRMEELQIIINANELRLEEMQNCSANQDQKIKESTATISELRREINDLNITIQSLFDDKKELIRELADARGSNTSKELETERYRRREEAERYNNIIENAQNEHIEIIKALKTKNEAIYYELAELKNSKNEIAQRMREKDSLITDLKIQIQNLDKEKDKFENDTIKLNSEILRLTEELDKLKSSIPQIIENTKKDVESEFRQRITFLEVDSSKEITKSVHFEKQILNLEEKLRDFQCRYDSKVEEIRIVTEREKESNERHQKELESLSNISRKGVSESINETIMSYNRAFDEYKRMYYDIELLYRAEVQQHKITKSDLDNTTVLLSEAKKKVRELKSNNETFNTLHSILKTQSAADVVTEVIKLKKLKEDALNSKNRILDLEIKIKQENLKPYQYQKKLNQYEFNNDLLTRENCLLQKKIDNIGDYNINENLLTELNTFLSSLYNNPYSDIIRTSAGHVINNIKVMNFTGFKDLSNAIFMVHQVNPEYLNSRLYKILDFQKGMFDRIQSRLRSLEKHINIIVLKRSKRSSDMIQNKNPSTPKTPLFPLNHSSISPIPRIERITRTPSNRRSTNLTAPIDVRGFL